jgi:cyclic beta-1,2-glucan synthetase
VERFAHQLAEHHTVDQNPKQKASLLKHLQNWEETLQSAYLSFRATSSYLSKDTAFFQAGERMLNNYYVVEQTLHLIEENLPEHYFDQLPKLDATALKGYSRIFALAWEWVGYSQGQLDLSQVAPFVRDYQEVTPLTIGELWALPTMLRIGILERLAGAVAKLTEIDPPKSLNAQPVLPVLAESSDEVIVANCFISLRLLSATDWKLFFEQISRVEQILRGDPAEIYTDMDFDTRNRYRGVVEELARHSSYSEEAIAQTAIELALDAQDNILSAANPVGALVDGHTHPNGHTPQTLDRKTHVGFYLIDAGRPALEKVVGYRPGWRANMWRWYLAHPTFTYLSRMSFVSLIILSGLLAYGYFSGGSFLQLLLVALLGCGLALEVALIEVEWNITHRVPPRTLPRMDFSEGIPAEYRTMVVIPTLLANADDIDPMLQDVELHYLCNPDPQLRFALLTDFIDAPAQFMPDDEKLLGLLKTRIENLNQKYAPAVIGRTAPFYVFHRERKWNPSEGVWMGWERKRGKLAEFNYMLLYGGRTSYLLQVGDLSILNTIKYVITLDADTSLPKGSAARLVATLAHPLNRAEFAADGRSVVAGYTILQPRVEIKPTSASRSRFAQIFAGDAGFDLYTLAVSNVYQDLFGEGSFVGKGIYDVAAFEKSVRGQIPENTLLNHDLFEGIHGRAALVTDVILYEEYPTRYLGYARRMRRRIREDWQLLPWILGLVKTENGIARKRISLINRWKVIDNLRRSLVPPNMVLILAAAWLGWLPGSPLVWSLLVLLTPTLPVLAQTLHHIRHNFGRLPLKELIEPGRLPALRWALAITFLPYEAFLSLSAIIITLVRMFITRKHMLQWTPAAYTARLFRLNARYEIQAEMTVSLVFISFLVLATALVNPLALAAAIPLLILWTASPGLAYWNSQPIVHTAPPLRLAEHSQVQRLARRTWAYFEQYVGPDDHWLPPDHFQEAPRGNIAHYTTPTNIGLLLLSTLSAYDLGYISVLELVVRLNSTFENMERLEHYRGHLLNQYDTQSMIALDPRYISTVESGNLASCLLALRQGSLAMKDKPIIGAQQWQGMLVILDILTNILKELESNSPGSPVEPFEIELDNIRERIAAIQETPDAWAIVLTWLSGPGWERVSRRLLQVLETPPANMTQEILKELQLYLDTMHHHLQGMQKNIDLLAPWLSHFNQQPPALLTQPNSPLAQNWQVFRDSIPAELPSLAQAVPVYAGIKSALAQLKVQLINGSQLSENNQEAYYWCQKLDGELDSAYLRVQTLLIGYRDLAARANTIFNAMDFKFLFDEQRQVFHIGYNVTNERLDASYYDLLASEARLASLIAIAKGDAPQNHWLHMGRSVTMVDGKQVLLSRSGTMVEYLMPLLFTKIYEETFLYESCHTALDAQIGYAKDQNIPWGVSESGYYTFDVNMNYQYRAFGVPILGYERGLPDNLVVAPYASLLGLPLQPQAVMENIAHFEELNMLGRFGMYESIDYTKARLQAGQTYAIVQAYMTHHQGMIMLSICNYLTNDIIVERFHADERVQSVELLLQEKIPRNPHIEYPHPEQLFRPSVGVLRSISLSPWRIPVDGPVPQVHFLSQGRYSLMITSAGGGYSQWQDFALTRWQSDTALDNWGMWIYILDCESDALWSAACQPMGALVENQEVIFSPHKVEFRRWDHDISLHTEITVGADGIEIRRVTVLNDSNRPRRLKLVSYGEVVLAARGTDQRHPAFNKLFIESEYIPENNALLFHRRPRSATEKPLYMAHALAVEPDHKVTGEYETSRAQFIGRGRTQRSPQALQSGDQKLSGTIGGTLDPILSLAQEIDLNPHTRTQVTFLTLAAPSRAEALDLLTSYQSKQIVNRAFDEARAESQRELIDLGLNSYGVEHVQRLLSVLLYPINTLRAPPHILSRNEKGQSGLWAYGISGDYPILLLRLHGYESPLLVETLQAYIYWRNRGIKTNLVILNEQYTGDSMDVHNQIYRQLAHRGAEAWLNQRDGIFLLRADQIQKPDRILLETVAGAILNDKNGTLVEHTHRLNKQPIHLPGFTPALAGAQDLELTPRLARPTNLLMDNGVGGFSPDGREYVIYLEPGQHTPHPWINVIANAQFGFLVSEAGSGCTWAENSGENRLTPWRNDPLIDMPGEALYLRDEETGVLWSPTPMPVGPQSACLIRHGAGYSIFENQSHGLNQRLRLFTAMDAPVKVVHLRVENLWTRPRRITVTYYAEWVLGTTREATQAYIIPDFDPICHALLAENHYSMEFGERVAFLAANKRPHGLTADRAEFLGRMGSMRAPAALGRIGLASKVSPGLDPCAVIQLHIDLAPGQAEEVFFLIGEGANREESQALIRAYQTPAQVEAAWEAVSRQWDEILGAITVKTPDPGMDLLLNRWALYQTLACRVWGRTALYQSSGAFGFRDQLQDVLALLHSRPDLAREQILNAARHQFDAGDVLHWWNPPSGKGVRTRSSDDLLWLPYVTAEYVQVTGDVSILEQQIPFLKGPPLGEGEDERYNLYESDPELHTLYEHCRRALEKGATAGIHGLPLMGSGDWNDGMNLVGIQGRGESVWLGWFLHSTMMRFAALRTLMREDPEPYRWQAAALAKALETYAWDGAWYLRAFYDDGSRLGSSANAECHIDSSTQSWAVLSGAADSQRAAQAMDSVYQILLDQEKQMILPFTPPFDRTSHDPGYIKGYAPGMRENGGQYTYTATWDAWAFAALGQGDRAAMLFQLLNPVDHTNTPEKMANYKTEPYSIANDIYTMPLHTGSGGWTWYTNSSSWMYRLGIEAILGISRSGNQLKINPCIPRDWENYRIIYKYGQTLYHINIENPDAINRGVKKLVVDNTTIPDKTIQLIEDGLHHTVNVLMEDSPIAEFKEISSLYKELIKIENVPSKKPSKKLDKLLTKLVDNLTRIVRFQISSAGWQYCSNYAIVKKIILSPLLDDLKNRIPASLVFFWSDKYDFNQLDRLYDSLRSSESILIFFIVSSEDNNQQLQQDIFRKFKVYGHDLIFFTFKSLRKILLSFDAYQSLRNYIIQNVTIENLSPYTDAGPTFGSSFFGREAEQRHIIDYVQDSSVAIIGGRRIGKTSILLNLHYFRLPQKGFRSICFDCSSKGNIDELLQSPVEWQPDIPPNNNSTTLKEVLQNPPKDKPLIILLDEADKLVPLDRKTNWTFFYTLRSLSNSKKLQVILGGERALHDAIEDSTGPLFNFASEILLGPLNFDEVEELITIPMKQMEIHLIQKAEIVKEIYKFTSGHPNVVQRLCKRLIKSLNSDREISLRDVSSVTADPDFIRTDFLGTYFSQAPVLEHLCAIIMASYPRIQTIKTFTLKTAYEAMRKHHIRASRNQVNAALQRLVKLRSILRETEAGYEFAVDAFPQIMAKVPRIDELLDLKREIFIKAGDIPPENAPTELKGRLW